MSNADIRGRFIWHELMTTAPDAAGAFYSKVVPWKTQPSGMPSYTLWMSGKTQIGGLMALPDGDTSGAPPHWIVYIGTADVDATVAQAERLGGKVLKSAADTPDTGRFAVLADPQGAAFAVYSPAAAAPESGSSAAAGEFTWHELATTDYTAALSFYVELFGWEKGATHEMGTMGIYQLVNRNGARFGGIYNGHSPATPPHWLSYVRVPDVVKATAAAKAGGGRILNGPIEAPDGSWIAMLMDPQGGAFAVVEPPTVAVAKTSATAPSSAAQAEKPKAPQKPKVASADSSKPAPISKAPASAPAPVQAATKKVARKAAPKAVKKAAKKAGKPARAKVKATRGKSLSRKAAGKKTAAKKTKPRKSAQRPAAKRAPAKRGKKAPARGKKRAAGKSVRGKSAKKR